VVCCFRDLGCESRRSYLRILGFGSLRCLLQRELEGLMLAVASEETYYRNNECAG